MPKYGPPSIGFAGRNPYCGQNLTYICMSGQGAYRTGDFDCGPLLARDRAFRRSHGTARVGVGVGGHDRRRGDLHARMRFAISVLTSGGCQQSNRIRWTSGTWESPYPSPWPLWRPWAIGSAGRSLCPTGTPRKSGKSCAKGKRSQ